MDEIKEAIEIIKECRDIHVQYYEWQEATPDWRERTDPDRNTGGPEFHRSWVDKYDKVLTVLDRLGDKIDG